MDSCGDSDDEAFFVNMHLAAAVASEKVHAQRPLHEGHHEGKKKVNVQAVAGSGVAAYEYEKAD